MFNDLTSLPRYLSTRRSGKPRDLIAPGPDEPSLRDILALAARTPDHGKLFPWRFVPIGDDARSAFGALLRKAFTTANPEAREIQIEAAIAPAFMAPSLVVLLYAPQPSPKIPLWEQQLSVGAAAMNLLHAAHAYGFAGSWITGWAAYDPIVRAELCEGDEEIAGFFYIGTPANPLEERPRPELDTIIRHWPKPTAA
ncbi:nitroreductase [Sphingorhabdus arenilitoris]|uniref:Putative NAD(P)H nitroreductase n=1 Tax=Sphingorhabdus arenilitoris TaxID=1490041 RepID=A0ABV8RJ33_9SPHN